MDLAEFEGLAEPLRRKSAAQQAEYGLLLVEGHTATAEEIARVEREMAVALPDKYKAFMMRYGGGMFGFVELFPTTFRPRTTGSFPTVRSSQSPRSALATTGASR